MVARNARMVLQMRGESTPDYKSGLAGLYSFVIISGPLAAEFQGGKNAGIALQTRGDLTPDCKSGLAGVVEILKGFGSEHKIKFSVNKELLI